MRPACSAGAFVVGLEPLAAVLVKACVPSGLPSVVVGAIAAALKLVFTCCLKIGRSSWQDLQRNHLCDCFCFSGAVGGRGK